MAGVEPRQVAICCSVQPGAAWMRMTLRPSDTSEARSVELRRGAWQLRWSLAEEGAILTYLVESFGDVWGTCVRQETGSTVFLRNHGCGKPALDSRCADQQRTDPQEWFG